MSYLTGVYTSHFGKIPGLNAWDLQVDAARGVSADTGIDFSEIDAVITGYATTAPHLMPANALADRLGIHPKIAFGMNVGGATGLAMLAQAATLAEHQELNVLVVAGENRATGLKREASTAILADVGHPEHEVNLGGNIPAYYALLADWYLNERRVSLEELAAISVHMRTYAGTKEGAHFSKSITVDDVMASRMVSDPLRLLHCCPVSDGGAAFIVSSKQRDERSLTIRGHGQAHQQQYLSTTPSLGKTGAGLSAQRALDMAGVELSDIDVFGIYDSFAVTFALIAEEIGLVPAGKTGEYAAAGAFAANGKYPTNTHGGLLSYGHSGVSGGMAHVVEVATQLRGERGTEQVDNPRLGFVHADGGVMSAHLSAILERTD